MWGFFSICWRHLYNICTHIYLINLYVTHKSKWTRIPPTLRAWCAERTGPWVCKKNQGNYTPLFHGFIQFYSTFLALVIMMTASAVIAALDDKRRHDADAHTNSQIAHRVCSADGKCSSEDVRRSFESALFYQLFTKVFLSHVSTILKLASMISKALSGCNHLVGMLHDRMPAYLSYLLVQFCSGGLTSQWETSSSLKENVNFQQICSHWPHRVKLVDAMWTPQIWMGKAIWNWKNLWNVHNNSCDMLQLTSPYWIKQSQTCLLYEVKL